MSVSARTPAPPPAPAAPAWPFVARGQQLDDLVSTLLAGEVDVIHLIGPSGVGKTRLATAVLRWAERDGFAVARVRASRGAAAVPLAALTTALPAGVLDGPPALVVPRAVEHIRDLGDGARVVVMVDDVDLLDAASMAVLTPLVEERLVHLVTTARDDAATPELLLAAIRHGRLRRVQVPLLDRLATATLLHLALEGPVSAPLEQALWDLSGGSPLYLRELVHAARESGALRLVDGVWTLASSLSTTSGLRDLVVERFGDVEPAARTALELTALCHVIGVADLEDAVGYGVVEELEASGLIEVDISAEGLQARLAHPVYGQVLRETMPSLRARRLLLGQVERLERRGADQHGDPLRIARWRLEATGVADPALLVQAAQLARAGHDFQEIERLCRAALAAGPDPEASVLLGEALYESGRFEDADAALAEALATAAPGDENRFGLRRAYNQFFGLGRLDDALATVEQTVALGSVPGRADLRALQALMLTHGGRSGEADAVLATLEPGGAPELEARVRALVLLRTGRLREAVAVGQEAWDRAPDTGQLLHPAGSLMVVAMARLAAGDLLVAAETATEAARAASRQGVEFQALWLRWISALVTLAAGDVVQATEKATEVLATATAGGYPGPTRLAAAALATAHAQRGAAEEAQALTARLDDATGPRELYETWVHLAHGWTDVARGDTGAAVARWTEAAERALGHGEVLAATDLLHDAVRLGDRDAARALVELAPRVEGPLSEARGLHARGLLEGVDHLVAAADRFAALGLHLVAAEVATIAAAASDLPRRERARVAALAAAERALCPQAATPALASAPSGTAGGLTARETQIARLAASGRSSKEIALELVLSVRTVDNHLQNAYTKLGVSGRDQLAAALGPSQDGVGA